MRMVKPPENWIDLDREVAIFLAGGITDCPDWQADIANMLTDIDVTLLNPRRDDFDVGNQLMSAQQIEWEFQHLRVANSILFWFPEETLCPITLFELGRWSTLGIPIAVGIHENYARKFDIEIQLALQRPEIEIVYSLEDLVTQIKEDFNA